jgi:O-antigen biosynthesis protein
MRVPDFTGERFVPGQGGAQIGYEHLHRYHFALRWVAGKDVLDVATGIGYGAALMALSARRVWALDIDQGSVQHARRSRAAANLEFLQGDATCLPVRSGSVDFAIALEVLEHVEQQEALVAELARVVRPAGTVLISTPNKASYSDARCYRNPFHVREFYRDEFSALLGRHFAYVRLLEQQVRAGSLILSQDVGETETQVFAEAVGGTQPLQAMYFLAICGAGAPASAIPAASAFLDVGDGLLLEWEQRLEAAGVEIARLNREAEQLGAWNRAVHEMLAARDQTIRQLQEEMSREIAARDDIVRQLQEEIGARTLWTEKLTAEVDARDEAVRQLQEEISARTGWAEKLEREVEARDETVRSLQSDMEREIFARDEVVKGLQAEFDERTRWAQALAGEVSARDDTLQRTNESLQHTQEELDRVSAHLARIRHALPYRILCRLGILPK